MLPRALLLGAYAVSMQRKQAGPQSVSEYRSLPVRLGHGGVAARPPWKGKGEAMGALSQPLALNLGIPPDH